MILSKRRTENIIKILDVTKKRKVEVMCYVECIDMMTNETNNVKINHYYMRYRTSRRICASNSRYVVNKVNKLTIILEGEIKKHVINTYLKLKFPTAWRKFFFNIANNVEYIINYCDDSYKKISSILSRMVFI